MTPFKNLVQALVLVLATAVPAVAQTPAPPEKPENIQISLGLLAGVPLGQFGNDVDSAGGLSGHLDVGLGDGVVSIGGDAAYLWYGTASRQVNLGVAIPDLPPIS